MRGHSARRGEENRVEYERLSTQAGHIEREGRMILPGVQALFGFQLVAATNTEFWVRFTRLEHLIHWFALGLVALAVFLALIPAAYHRQVEVDRVSQDFIRIANRALYWALYPMMLAICLDFYIIGRGITGSPVVSAISSIALLAVFVTGWFIFPRLHARARRPRALRVSDAGPSR